MATRTSIEWTDATWNPWMGCLKVSPGCKACYMYREQERYGQDPKAVRRSKTKFKDPLRWTEPRRVFTCSWSDFFIEQADVWRAEAWDIIRRTPHLTYQILTKRPERIAGHLPFDWGKGWPHVWLGVSAEDQQRADERIPVLLQTPAAVRWVSAEPLLAPIDLDGYIGRDLALAEDASGAYLEGRGLDWLVVGGESGSGARPCDVAWIRSIVAECKASGIACFVKQVGAFPVEQREVGTAKGGCARPIDVRDRKGGDPAEWPEDLRVREFPKVPA